MASDRTVNFLYNCLEKRLNDIDGRVQFIIDMLISIVGEEKYQELVDRRNQEEYENYISYAEAVMIEAQEESIYEEKYRDEEPY